MEIVSSLKAISHPIDTITIGFFDGCHLGHSQLLNYVAMCPGTSAIITFPAHPQQYLSQSAPCLITTVQQKLALLSAFAIDSIILLPFDKKIASETARSFLTHLCETLHIRRLVLGYDSRIGKDLCGYSRLLPIAQDLSIELVTIPPYHLGDDIVSSHRIRELLHEGKLQTANAYLGHDYTYEGVVEKGAGLGKTWGIPTLNIFPQQNLLPLGVYVCEVLSQGHTYPAVMNLGTAPTFQRDKVCLEAHILNASPQLYGEYVSIVPKQFLREEQQFPSHEELQLTIKKDIADAQRFFRAIK